LNPRHLDFSRFFLKGTIIVSLIPGNLSFLKKGSLKSLVL